ncbi:unnamed protein product [Spirodela intermedia]|uniref:Chorein N-terminal domain-containing protein n=1 Tax=Spirodela intermedia TaxID=51605 RepID=A0A7I8IPD5_SPIIN|nr:unnamed protein product [Spirodela intermedia]CAA6659808.1 unnamed protein product [Spirodela intermedia]
MFEDYVLYLLRKYLGEYVHGLSTELLRISVWKGDVVLKDLNLKAEALNSLKLPVIVRAGFIGSITLKVLFLGFILSICQDNRFGSYPVVLDVSDV